jgi:hypothetical protein
MHLAFHIHNDIMKPNFNELFNVLIYRSVEIVNGFYQTVSIVHLNKKILKVSLCCEIME